MDSGPTDAELVARAQLGDKDAFGQLADRYQFMARNLAWRMVSEADLADDLVQEALLQAYLSLRHLNDDARFRSWFYGIVLNVCRNFLRERDAQTLSLDDLVGGLHVSALASSDDECDPYEHAERRELNRMVFSAVQALPRKDRLATLLFYYESFSVREIAEALDMSDVAVRVHMHKARATLKQQLASLRQQAAEAEPEAKTRTRSRRKDMANVPVSIADMIEERFSNHRVVVLLHEPSHRALPIWIGEAEASAIVRILKNVSFPRPMTTEFTGNLLKAAGVGVQEVRVATLKEDTFYSVVKLRNGKVTQEVDARPSDALALAALMGSPILVEEELLNNQGVDVSETHLAVLGRGLEASGKRLQEEVVKAVAPADDDERTYREFQKLLLKRNC